MQPFILNDENQVNSYGFVVLNAGGKLDRFFANPVMLNGHDYNKLVGKWNNLTTVGSVMSAEPEFDEADPEALKVKGKVERGYLKGASMGIIVLAMEYMMHNNAMMLCATEWELLEASTVPVPSNANCLRLYNTKGEQLEDNEQIQLNIKQILKHKTPTMEKITLNAEANTALGLKDGADENAISAAVVNLHARVQKAEAAIAENIKLQATTLVGKAIAEGRITADKKEAFEKLAVADFANADTILSALPVKQTLSDKVKTVLNAEKDAWDFRKWQKEDPKGLAKMHAENFDGYEKLRTSYGV